MARLGHSTPAAAMRYQHAAQDADQTIAEKLSAMVTAAEVRSIRSEGESVRRSRGTKATG